MNPIEAIDYLFPKKWRPYIATAVLTAACCAAYAQIDGRIGAIEQDRAVKLPEFSELKRDVADTKTNVAVIREKLEGFISAWMKEKR